MCVRITLYSVLLLMGVCAAQTGTAEKAPETTFRVGTDLVLLNVSVFDQDWKVIKGLPKSAFTVFENKVKQEVSVFRQEDVPVSLGLIVDNSASMRDKGERAPSPRPGMGK